MNFGTVLCTTFLAIWSIALFSTHDTLVSMLLINGALQLVLFTLVACIPYLRTGRMSWVDIAWPFGVALIGVQIILLGDGNLMRKLVVGAVYLMIGLRMGIGALTMAKTTGVIFRTEFPRYQYRRMVLEKEHPGRIRFYSLAEMMAQGFANASVLALPGFLMATNGNEAIAVWEIAGLCLWAVAYGVESTADAQKMLFIARGQGDVCNIGLWRYSRHPNYFAEWLVWTGLVIAAVPSWWLLQGTEPWPVWMVLGLGAAAASLMLYITLVYLTGAIPAEYYSVQKRPGYRAYQESTNRFFPWFPKT